ncbi:MAG TPA: hypothetical protein VFY79_06380 [Dehalococcoidia bacterium]|nr:hypothetical protein [Dehalococcoidia bacterium]
MPERIGYRQWSYARAKGRNGWFVPRVLEYAFSRHADGTTLVTLRIYSRRAADAPPVEITMSASDWERQALAVQLGVNEDRRTRHRTNKLPQDP